MANTLFIGKVYHRFEALASTNDRARELLSKSKPPEGMVVRADSQSAGRGQFGSPWESEPGTNLTLSVVLYPGWLPAEEQFWLSMAVGLGVKDAVTASLSVAPLVSTPPPTPPPKGRGVCLSEGMPPSPSGEGSGEGLTRAETPTIKIKWPNDLYLGDRKIAGILIENSLSGPKIQSSIIGIGLNVNQLVFQSDAPNPTSLALATGHTSDLDAVADVLFECLERRYLQLKAGQKAALKADYLAALYRFGQTLRYRRTADGTTFEGVIRGVTDRGLLEVETPSGFESFDLKQLRFLI